MHPRSKKNQKVPVTEVADMRAPSFIFYAVQDSIVIVHRRAEAKLAAILIALSLELVFE